MGWPNGVLIAVLVLCIFILVRVYGLV